jgi:hypothetical protein
VAEFLVLVNGLPGSGKTTLAGQLSETLHVPLLSKDSIKEALTGVPPSEAGRVASETLWDLAAGTAGPAVLESWWFRPRDLGFVESGRMRCGNPPTLEIWCQVPPELALARVRGRKRAAVHQDDLKVAAHWAEWAEGARPLGVSDVTVVETAGPVDVAGLAERVRVLAGLPGSGERPGHPHARLRE